MKTTKTKFDYTSIKSFEDACKKLNIDPAHLPDLSTILEEFRKPITAAYKLMIIFKAINDDWTPDWSNQSQWKYYPWYEILSSGFGFSDSYYGNSGSVTCVGSCLCTDSSDKALYISKQFEAEYKEWLL